MGVHSIIRTWNGNAAQFGGFFVHVLWTIVTLLTENLYKKGAKLQVNIQVDDKSPNGESGFKLSASI